MPTYEYACTSCGQHVDVVQSFSDDPLTTCPSCGGTLRKVYAPVGIVLKGSGFYKTDSRSPKKGGRSDGDGSSAGKAEKSSDGATNGSGGSGSKESKAGTSGDSSAGNSAPAAAASS
jgi:putative FmdB family regulatory protein